MTQTATLLILLLPALGGALLGCLGLRMPRAVTRVVGPGVVWLGFLLTLVLLATGSSGDFTYWTWISSGSFTVPFDLYVDHLSLFMCLVITGVGGLIVTYATGYMEHEDDASYARFFCYMDVFVFSMLVLVLAGNVVFLIIGWALVGLSSYLLIGFYYWRRSAVLAARKAFVMNVIGDIGLVLAAFVLFVNYHQLGYSALFAGALPGTDSGPLELAGFLLLVGGIAKSAQLPLHTWLPDAMEGPTPVSALIHAATMVTAGVYLVARFHPLYDVAVYAHGAVAIIGAASALFAATIALVQTDIKRVLAYSTMSQIGYMFLAVGIGAYSAGLFHLLAHAFFKALLFMAAGNVIHAMADEQDMRRFGGLWRQLRGTSLMFLAGSLSLAGIVPLVGFFSKDAILGEAFSRGDGLGIAVWLVGVLTALLTAFYTGRMWWITFAGPPSPERPVEHPHEAPGVMFIPVAILAGLTLVGGVLNLQAISAALPGVVNSFLDPVVGVPSWPNSQYEPVLAIGLTVLSALAFLSAHRFWVSHRWSPATWRSRLPRVTRALEHKYYFDELYDAAFVRTLDAGAAGGSRYLDTPLLDGAVNGVGALAELGGGLVAARQTGFIRSYMLVFAVSVLVIGLLLVWRFA